MESTQHVLSQQAKQANEQLPQTGELKGHKVSQDTASLPLDPSGCAQAWGTRLQESGGPARSFGYACCQSTGPLFCWKGDRELVETQWCCGSK